MSSTSSSSHKLLYSRAKWRRLRRRKLLADQWCECPHHRGKFVQADVVDHKVPHRGNLKLFYDYKNLQSMAKECHDTFKQSQEKGGIGFDRGCDEQGNPLNQEHSWYG